MKETNETLIKSANDLKVEITKLNGEKVVDEECCTSIVLMLKNSGEMGTSFLGAHNKTILRAMKKAINKYFKILNKSLKSAPNEENIIVEKDVAPPDVQNNTGTNNFVDESNKLQNNTEKSVEKNNSDKDTLSKKSKKKSNKNKLNKTLHKSKSNGKSAEQQSIDEVQEIIKDIKRMQDKYKEK